MHPSHRNLCAPSQDRAARTAGRVLRVTEHYLRGRLNGQYTADDAPIMHAIVANILRDTLSDERALALVYGR
jgi:hypothetical protein